MYVKIKFFDVVSEAKNASQNISAGMDKKKIKYIIGFSAI
jgi:hypothetical protein